MRRTIFLILIFLLVLAILYLVIFRADIWKKAWNKILIAIAGLFPFGQALNKKLAEIDKEFARRREEESTYQAKMAERRDYLEKEIIRLEKEITLLDKKYELLEKQRSTIVETIEAMPREKRIELFREAYGE
ncbi:MAG: hypothetical protein ONB16_09050 [candidate division KSB1 bacterium]|nr:hypothetical protein [candidate division KSB1 bacterium]MDZ7319175.1 hypothetical protein [candidate division KSB1 bacterium]MDZ7339766.1 hypothetical protein [candidate division KSB1 bacterium]